MRFRLNLLIFSNFLLVYLISLDGILAEKEVRNSNSKVGKESAKSSSKGGANRKKPLGRSAHVGVHPVAPHAYVAPPHHYNSKYGRQLQRNYLEEHDLVGGEEERSDEDALIESKFPYHRYDKFNMEKAPAHIENLLNRRCDLGMYDSYVRPIYERQLNRQGDADLHEKFQEFLNRTAGRHSSDACFGYMERPSDPDNPVSDRNNTASVFYGYLECRQTDPKNGTSILCRCLKERDKMVGMHHINKSVETSHGKQELCIHPLDILDSCNYEEWRRLVGEKLDKILSAIKGKPLSHKLIKTLGKQLDLLLQNITKEYGQDEEKLKAICFTQDFSLVCNKWSFCTCHQHRPHFYFKRSVAFDRCIPTLGSWCVASPPNNSATDPAQVHGIRDECIESTCEFIFPRNASLDFDSLVSKISLVNSVKLEEPLPYQACGGFEGWNMTDGAWPTGHVDLFHFSFIFSLSLCIPLLNCLAIV